MKTPNFQFQRHRIDKISKERIMSELVRVAGVYEYTYFTSKDFLTNASIGHQTVFREFGTWNKAMDYLRDYLLKEKNITLKPRTKPKRKDAYTIKQLFDEMQRVWTKVGHRPSKIEWEQAEPKINYNTVRRHFNGWTNACLKFIEYVTGETVVNDDNSTVNEIADVTQENVYKPENSRTIPLGTRLEVLSRDKFRCVLCGKSPASDIGTVLHVDHIRPFSSGGRTILGNLQTLCKDCNLGKSNHMIEGINK